MTDKVPTSKIHRNPSIEMLRVFLMLGICILHAVSHGGNRVPWMNDGLRWCVNGFVFISGWYGIKFLPSKALRLLALSLGAGLISIGVGIALGVWSPSSASFAKDAYRMLTGHWFLSAYILLMLASPILNVVLDQISSPDRFVVWAVPLVVLACWSWAVGMPVVGSYVPTTPGLGDYTGLSLIGTYVTAGILRRIGAERCQIKWLLIVGACALPFCMIGFGGYASPFAIAMAAVVFLLVSKVRLSKTAADIFTFATPSMFAVLLISQKAGFTLPYIISFEDALIDSNGINSIIGCVLVGCCMFLVSFALDMVRRFSVFCIAKPMRPIYLEIDTIYCDFLENLAQKLEFIRGGGKPL